MVTRMEPHRQVEVSPELKEERGCELGLPVNSEGMMRVSGDEVW